MDIPCSLQVGVPLPETSEVDSWEIHPQIHSEVWRADEYLE